MRGPHPDRNDSEDSVAGQDPDRFRQALIDALPRLWRYGYALTGCREDCNDLVQSTCERALVHRHQWQANSRLENWAMAIMQSVWKNQLRAQSVRLGNGQVDPETHLTHDGIGSMELALRTRELKDALQDLPTDQRTAIRAVYIDGRSYRETADLLGVPVGTVMSRLSRARLALVKRLEEGSV